MSWTDERVELLKKMWTEGQSASQIAKELGSVTRNAVIGKVHRLGLSNRAGTPVAGAATGPTPAPTAAPAATSADPTPAARTPDSLRMQPRADSAQADPLGADAPVADDVAVDAADAGPYADDPDDLDAAEPERAPMSAARRAIIPAGQPLPPQPSANEISPEALAKVNEVEKHAKKLTLMELTERTCKWPVGDPATPDFWFCGLPVRAGKPYCDAHVGVAFQPMSARRDRKR